MGRTCRDYASGMLAAGRRRQYHRLAADVISYWTTYVGAQKERDCECTAPKTLYTHLTDQASRRSELVMYLSLALELYRGEIAE